MRAGPLSVLRWRDADAAAREGLLGRGLAEIFDPVLRESIVAIIEDVREHGDEAVARALERFDGCRVDPRALRVSEREFESARRSVAPEVQNAVREAIANIRAFNQAVLRERDWRVELRPGLVVGEKITPIAGAGLFVPSGKGSFPSVLIQLGTPAVVAEVPQIAVVVPPAPGLQALPEPRRSYAMSALGDNGGCVLVGDLSEAVELANDYAPEHMQLAVREEYEEALLGRLEHAGEILVGQQTPIAAANYTIGVPAALPTGGFARVTSGVTAESFLKRTSIARADAAALRSMAPAALALAAHEGFPAHAAAIRARLDEAF